ncbi:MAG TPA: Sec-independent protein translocase subunit TatA [Jatrophihabitans sp.]|jgi:sec-independent protein translocase protein TatA
MGWESPSHWVIIALAALVLFGYKRLPEMSRSVGRSLRIFKTEIKGMDKDDAARDAAETAQPSTDQSAVVLPPAVSSPVVAPPVVTPPPVTPSAVAPVTPAPPAAEETSQQRTQA